jgi:hypothetical protein
VQQNAGDDEEGLDEVVEVPKLEERRQLLRCLRRQPGPVAPRQAQNRVGTDCPLEVDVQLDLRV